jgi:transposase-like protein
MDLKVTITAADGAARAEGHRAGRPVRRTFTDAYKLKIVSEYETETARGARGNLLRREGLYRSHINKWRQARDREQFTGPAGGNDGPSGRGSSGGGARLSET